MFCVREKLSFGEFEIRLGKASSGDVRRDGKKSPLFSNANNIHFKNSEPKKSCEFSKKGVKFFWYQVDI